MPGQDYDEFCKWESKGIEKRGYEYTHFHKVGQYGQAGQGRRRTVGLQQNRTISQLRTTLTIFSMERAELKGQGLLLGRRGSRLEFEDMGSCLRVKT